MRVNLLFAFLFLYAMPLFGSQVKIDAPKEVVKGESFNITFSVEMEGDELPQINFRPVNIDVISRDQSGVSTRTTYANGKLTVKKTVLIEYQLVGLRQGRAELKDIEITVGGDRSVLENYRFNVLDRASRPQSHFVLPVVSNENPFVGESIIVRYYIYSKTEIQRTEIKKFPDFKGFLKRYHQEAPSPEAVNFKGEMYRRVVAYTAQLFAEKPGKLTIPTASFSIVYTDSRGRSSFPFGINVGALKTKTLVSNLKEIEVKPIPLERAPKGFTGLVGSFALNFDIAKTQYIANEPIEARFEISGDGSLESFPNPKILTVEQIEEFDVSSDFQINNDFSAKKVLQYTYLGRGNYSSSEQKIEFSFFNPKKEQFYTETITIPPLEIRGSSLPQNSSRAAKVGSQVEQVGGAEELAATREKHDLNILGPQKIRLGARVYRIINYLMITGILLTLSIMVFVSAAEMRYRYPEEVKSAVVNLKSGRYRYNDLYSIVSYLSSCQSPSLYKKVDSLNLKNEMKNKIKEMITHDGHLYSQQHGTDKKKAFSKSEIRYLLSKIKKNEKNKIS